MGLPAPPPNAPTKDNAKQRDTYDRKSRKDSTSNVVATFCHSCLSTHHFNPIHFLAWIKAHKIVFHPSIGQDAQDQRSYRMKRRNVLSGLSISSAGSSPSQTLSAHLVYLGPWIFWPIDFRFKTRKWKTDNEPSPVSRLGVGKWETRNGSFSVVRVRGYEWKFG